MYVCIKDYNYYIFYLFYYMLNMEMMKELIFFVCISL